MAPYSTAIKAGNNLYVSGMLALDRDGKVVAEGDVVGQTRHVLEAIKAVLETAGGTLEDVVFNTVLLKDLGDYGAMNAVYAEYFPKRPPARYCIRADLVRPEFLVEIASIAYLEILHHI
nr:Rid family hydrolase [Bradyrhizobium sp. AUGA SZCCT0182]